MPKFAAHTFVHDGLTSHSFDPGDEVPDWALDQVGDHVLVPEEKAKPEESDAPADSGTQDEDPGGDSDSDSDAEDDVDGEEDTPPPADDQPDFTAPAPARRGRSRKQ